MLLLLLGCTSMRSTSDAPFDLGRLQSALWFESAWSSPDDGWGNATVLLVDEEFSCAKLEAELSGEIERRDSIIWTASGLLLTLQWQDTDGANLGWAGDYYQGTTSTGYYYYYYDYAKDVAGGTVRTDRRTLSVQSFDEGAVWTGQPLLARLTIDGGGQEIAGSTSSDWWKARFKAENCGQVAPNYGYYGR